MLFGDTADVETTQRRMVKRQMEWWKLERILTEMVTPNQSTVLDNGGVPAQNRS
jgi:hypothetical protein